MRVESIEGREVRLRIKAALEHGKPINIILNNIEKPAIFDRLLFLYKVETAIEFFYPHFEG